MMVMLLMMMMMAAAMLNGSDRLATTIKMVMMMMIDNDADADDGDGGGADVALRVGVPLRPVAPIVSVALVPRRSRWPKLSPTCWRPFQVCGTNHVRSADAPVKLVAETLS